MERIWRIFSRLFLYAAFITLLIGLFGFVFLNIENLSPRLTVEFNELAILTDSTVYYALFRSVGISIFSALIIFLLIEKYLSAYKVSNRNGKLLLGAVAVLAVIPFLIDPVSRVLSYRSFAEGIDLSIGSIIGEPRFFVVSTFLMPIVVFSWNFAPIYFFVRLLGTVKRYPLSNLSPRVRFGSIYSELPSVLSRMPFGVSLLFFLCLFDPWILEILGGNKANYFGPLIVSLAREARDIESAVLVSFLGFTVVILVWLLTSLLVKLGLRIINTITVKPLVGGKERAFNLLFLPLVMLGAAFSVWPILWLFGKAGNYDLFLALVDISNLQSSTIIMAVLISIVATIMGIFQWQYLRMVNKRAPVRFLLLFLALAPEVLLVVVSTFVTGSGLIDLSYGWTVVIFLSFSAPICALMMDGYFTEERAKQGEILSNLIVSDFYSFGVVLRQEYFPMIMGVTMIVAWLFLENVVLVSSTLPPGGETASMWVYGEAKRSFEASEAAAAIALMLNRIILLLLPLIAIVFFEYRHRSFQSR